MTAPLSDRELEASSADETFQLALLYMGVETIEDSLALWQGLPVGSSADQAAEWLDHIVALTMSRRTIGQQLAIAYYRFVRALRTGKTIPDPLKPAPGQVTLAQLRWEFEQLVNTVDQPSETPGVPSPPPHATPSTHEPQAGSDDEVIEVEDIGATKGQLDAIEKQAETETREILTTLGPVHQERLASRIDKTRPATEVDKLRTEAHDRAGIRQASAAELNAINGARNTLYSVGGKDSRVLGWVRRSRTGTPCGFCAMLISRGPELIGDDGKPVRLAQIFFTETTASKLQSDSASVMNGKAEVGDSFHPNCHCYAVPIYSTKQFQLDPAFDLNREYAKLWPKVTSGLSGDDALRAWRNFIDAQKRDDVDEPTPTKANAQAA